MYRTRHFLPLHANSKNRSDSISPVMAGRLSKVWLSPREAASVIGRELLGRAWNENILDRDIADDRLLQDVRSDLYKAVSSGLVKVMLDDGGDPFFLRIESTAHFAFNINLHDDCIILGELPGEKFNAQIHAIELRQFLSRRRAERSGKSASATDKTDFRKWLRELFEQDAVRSKKAALRSEASDRFRVSGRDFDRVWKCLADQFPNAVVTGRPRKLEKP